jgi:hypothetical protein
MFMVANEKEKRVIYKYGAKCQQYQFVSSGAHESHLRLSLGSRIFLLMR